jgi:hypothetical protein
MSIGVTEVGDSSGTSNPSDPSHRLTSNPTVLAHTALMCTSANSWHETVQVKRFVPDSGLTSGESLRNAFKNPIDHLRSRRPAHQTYSN